MAKQRYINTRFWIDGYIEACSIDEKLVFLYLITNPKTDICGIYELPLSHVIAETGVTRERVLEIFEKFQKDDRILYMDGWMVVKRFIEHQNLNPSIVEGIKRGLESCPKKILDSLGTAWVEGVYSLIHIKLKSKLKLKPKLKLKLKVDDACRAYLETWNKTFGTNLKTIVALRSNMDFWLNEYSLDEIKRAVTKIPSHPYWGKTNMNIETLLRRRNPRGDEVDYIGEMLNQKTIQKQEVKRYA